MRLVRDIQYLLKHGLNRSLEKYTQRKWHDSPEFKTMRDLHKNGIIVINHVKNKIASGGHIVPGKDGDGHAVYSFYNKNKEKTFTSRANDFRIFVEPSIREKIIKIGTEQKDFAVFMQPVAMHYHNIDARSVSVIHNMFRTLNR